MVLERMAGGGDMECLRYVSSRARANLWLILFLCPTPQIIMPAVMAPALMVLFWADIKAKKLGVLSIAASSYDRRVKGKEKRLTWWQLTRNWWVQIDAVGLILLGVGWALVLLPFTLYRHAEDGWENGETSSHPHLP